MAPKSELSSGATGQLAGVSRATILSWYDKGLIRSTEEGRFGEVAQFIACLAAEYRRRKWPWDAIAPCCRHLNGMSKEQLDAYLADAVADGKEFLWARLGAAPQFIAEGEPFHFDQCAGWPIPVARHWAEFQAKRPRHVRQKTTALSLLPKPSREMEPA